MHFFVFTFGSMWLRLGFGWAYLHRQSAFLLGTTFCNLDSRGRQLAFRCKFHISEIGGVASIAISSSLRAWTLAANHMWSHSLCFCQRYFALSANNVWGISFLHRQLALRVISRILHRQLTLLCNLIFLIVSGATFISCRMLWLC